MLIRLSSLSRSLVFVPAFQVQSGCQCLSPLTL
jgi:hypothetical protein